MIQVDYGKKVVLVTGGTSGIGKATAQIFAQVGAQVVITARDKERGRQAADELNGEAGAERVYFIPTDMGSGEAIEQLFAQLLARYNRLDFLVNNAASEAGVGKPLHDFEEAEFDQTMAVNYKAVWWCMKYAIGHMIRQQPAGGAIVNVSSINGLGGVAGGSLYAASKAALLSLTKSAALEYARFGVKINAFVPGFFDTPLLQNAFAAQTDGSPEAMAFVKRKYEDAIPLGHIASPDQAANAILWLCNPQTPYLAGHSLIMDGGVSALYR